jgi:hexosaminidase
LPEKIYINLIRTSLKNCIIKAIMKRILLSLVIPFLVMFSLNSQGPSIIPAPEEVILMEGEFVFRPETRIISSEPLLSTAELFAESISVLLKSPLMVSSKGKSQGNIILKLDKSITHPEGYVLNIYPSHIEVKASSAAGIYYGLQSLRQLLDCSGKEVLQAQSVKDSPRFLWRGVMLDVSRTFMPVNLVKRYIDLFSQYKLNVVHLHLTDDQGWRVEIKRYPLLTEIGSKFDTEFNTMGGYYSHDDIREMVRYAQLRNVMLVPEIEMPGHACAAIASYPDLSCESVRPKIHTFFEGKSIHEEIFCAGKESTYEMIFGILDELCGLFPSPYVHIGGDEAPKAMWKKCPYCQKAMKDNNLANEEELQSYFVKRIGDYLRTKNKTLVGWDEIMEGGKLAGNEVLMFWRGWKLDEVEKEVNAGFKVVCTPTTHCYFDYSYDKINTRLIYEYEPVIAGTNKDNYLGVQANFWSHIDRSEYNIDKQLFPRILGLAEIAWSRPENRKWEQFRISAIKNIDNLRSGNVNVYNDQSLK